MLKEFAAVACLLAATFVAGVFYGLDYHEKEQAKLKAQYEKALEEAEQTRQRYAKAGQDAKETYEKTIADLRASKRPIYRTAERMQNDLHQVSSQPLYPAFGASSPTTSDLAIAFSESVGEYLQVVGEAQEARARGLACETQYNGLKK